jgi:hypothetical protein
MSASGKHKNRKFDQETFRKGVCEFYETLKVGEEGKLKWCHLLQEWFPAKEVKAAHYPRVLLEKTYPIFSVWEPI